MTGFEKGKEKKRREKKKRKGKMLWNKLMVDISSYILKCRSNNRFIEEIGGQMRISLSLPRNVAYIDSIFH